MTRQSGTRQGLPPAELLRRTRPLSVVATALACMWLFGNLYEELVWNPRLLADPRPGTLVGAFAAGSPVYYYLPWTPLGVLLVVVLRVRFGGRAPAGVRRAWTAAIGLFAAAIALKILLITRINPVFRDPAVASAVVHDRAVWWAVGNGLVIVAVAAAVVLLTAWRRG